MTLRKFVSPTRDVVLTGLVVGLVSAFLVSFALYLRFSFKIYPTVSFNSDDSAWLLLANEMLKQHSLFPHWYSSTAIQLPLTSPKLLLLPVLLAISEQWMACFRVAVAVDQLLMSLLIWWVLGRVGLCRALRLFLLCFLFASVSPHMAEQTVMIAGQDWFYAQMLLLAYLVYLCLQSESPGDGGVAWSRFVWLGGVTTILFIDRSNISQMLPPLIAAVIALWATRFDQRSSMLAATTLVVLILAAFAGEFIYRFLLPKAVSYHPISTTFVDLDSAGANLQLFVRGLLDLFGAAPVPGRNIYSISTIWWAVKLGLLGVVFLGPLWMLAQWRQLKSDFLRLLIVIFSVSLALRMLVYVFTGISAGAITTNRYFISVSLVGLSAILLYLGQHWRRLPTYAGALTVAAILAVGSPLSVARPAVPSEYQQIAGFLERHQLRYGYATYWNAGVLTALSDNKVQARQVLLRGDGTILPFQWLSSSDWYQGDPNLHESFLLLRGGERNFDLHKLKPSLGEPTRIESFGDYRVLVYPFDIAQRLGWGTSMQGRLASADRHADIRSIGKLTWSQSSHRWIVQLRVTNLGPLPIGSNAEFPVNLGVHLFNSNGQLLDRDYARAALPMIASGKAATLVFEFPDSRANGNIVEFDLVQEGVAWFSWSGNNPLRLQIPPAPASGGQVGAALNSG